MKTNTRYLKTYDELIKLKTFEERFNYLKLDGVIGEDTFGFDRWINQKLYHSKEWEQVRNYVIARDNGCDLGHQDMPIYDEEILIHHMNPISKDDIINNIDYVLNPKYLITTIKRTHNAIHYGNKDLLPKAPIERTKYDTCPWRHEKGV